MSLLKRTTVVTQRRILALHGKGSNTSTTKMQLDNLEFHQSEYDIVYLNGPLEVTKSGPGVEDFKGLISGPWFSWIPEINDDGVSEQLLFDGICDAIANVLLTMNEEGPFDGIYGFSQGGVIAHFIVNLSQDKSLLSAVSDKTNLPITTIVELSRMLRVAIITCAAAPFTLSQLRARLGSGPASSINENNNTHSVHLIGREDEFKSWSESLALENHPARTSVYYMAGGHEVNRLASADGQIRQLISECFTRSESLQSETEIVELDWQVSSQMSARAVDNDVQLTEVNIDTCDLPQTIFALLASQPVATPLFRIAREQNADIYTSYGQMLNFCQPQGAGDLRRIGVKSAEPVAYIAPSGGSAVGAVAFLSIAAQTCAVPFSPSMSESEALLALEQYGVKHMILFDGIMAKGVRAAFEHYATVGEAKLHYAIEQGVSTPGLFDYLDQQSDFCHLPELINPADANGLLLRTSGTTSIPKIVPLSQRELVINGAILADGIGLTADDVTYSVMPLDHIGGISASILSSVAVGASITCDGLYNPKGMVDALQLSNPQPTWYSAVPTIHNSTLAYLRDNAKEYLNTDGQWQQHGLRMIRSGAAALKESDRNKLETVYDCPVFTTYSMSELMPISQPDKIIFGQEQLAGEVGVPVSASLAVVDPKTLKPLSFGTEGEIAIYGPTVFKGYMNNPQANDKSRFLLHSPQQNKLEHWFLTGDIGELDGRGTLALKGRIKELIKRGGEQVSPAEVEEVLTQHEAVQTAVCFSVPSDIYGEEVGCALVLNAHAKDKISQQELTVELKKLLKQKGLASYKCPSLWKLVEDKELPKTASRKFIRNGLSAVLGVSANTVKSEIKLSKPVTAESKPVISEPKTVPDASGFELQTTMVESHDKPKVDWAALAGLRFVLACYVMFMHIGSEESWGAFANLRQFPWHVHTFFTLAGFSLAIIMPAMINRKLSFVSARIGGMYPLYALAVVLALGNLLVSCQPSTFNEVFSWSPLLTNTDYMFCQGTPLVQDSWFANLLLTFGIHATGLQATPLWGATWFLGFYLWFISMYFQCLIVFPWIYNALYKNRGNTKKILGLTVVSLIVNFLIVLGFWYGYAVDASGYGLFDSFTGLRTEPTMEQITKGGEGNATILGYYLFAPFWMVYFIAGMCAAFLFDAIRPSEQQSAKLWGYTADFITLLILMVSIGHIAQGYVSHGADVMQVPVDQFFMRPEEANSYADPATVNRIWDNIWGRLFAPITLLWIFAISTGQGFTAKILRFNALSQVLAPTAYACFLFHQMVGQWYYAATRNGQWWNWWSDQKVFYWFSPQPVPVEWYEFFYVVGLVVLFAKLVQSIEPILRNSLMPVAQLCKTLVGQSDLAGDSKDTLSRIMQIIERTTGMEVEAQWDLEDCGLASLGVVQFAGAIETEFSTAEYKVSLPVSEIMMAESITEVAAIVDGAVDEAKSPNINLNSGTMQMV